MRILYNTYPFAFDCPGGGEIQLLKSRAAVERLGVEVLLYDPWAPQFRQVDAVHFFSVFGGSRPFCNYVKKLGLPLLISPVLWLTEENKPRMPLDEIRQQLRLADAILPNSQAEADQLAQHFKIAPGKFRVTYNGVDESFARPADPQVARRHFGLERPFVLNVANVEPRKNQLLLIESLRGLGLDLILLGNVRSAEYFDACMQAGRGWVKHLGYLEHASELLKSMYAACEVFAMPSLLETPSLAALEAAAQGAKMVVTSVGSTREYFEDFVEYVEPTDGSGLRQAVERLHGARADQRLREHVLAHFTWQHTGQALVAAYESVK